MTDPPAPELANFDEALSSRRWDWARHVLAEQPADVRCALILDTTNPLATEVAQGALAEDPQDTIAAAVLAGRLIEQAEQFRANDSDRFVSTLIEAERVLSDATAYRPDDPTIWALRLRTAGLMRLELSEGQRRYQRLVAQHPQHFWGQLAMVQILCQETTDGYQTPHAFARQAMLEAPEGALTGSLVAHAVIDHLLKRANSDQPRFTNPVLHAHLLEAGRRSVLNPAFRPVYGWVDAHNRFALAFSLLDDHGAARLHYQAIGGQFSQRVWDVLAEPVKAYEKFRTAAGMTP